MTPIHTIPSFLVAALLGFLIGLERERKRESRGSIFAGIRTFPLIALFGAICGQLMDIAGTWIIIAGLVSMGALLLLAYWRESAGEKVGGTTAVTAFVAFGLGIIAGTGEFVTALAGAVITTTILSLKDELRTLAGGITRADLFAVVQFAAVSLVILPLVPNEPFGPWGVWNPRSIWLLVVLISGISFVGYVLSKVISTKRSIGLSGFIGGLASSTAVTLSFSERSKQRADLSTLLASGVMAATAISILRLLVIIGILQRSLILATLPTFGIYFLISAISGLIIFRSSLHQNVEGAKLTNPFELRTAITFALLFAIILLVTRAAQEFFGNQGVFIASGLAGLSQLDAITVTLAKQVSQGLAADTAIKSLAIALAGNSIFKIGIAFSLGSRRYARVLSIGLTVSAIASLLVAWFFPIETFLPQ